MNADVLSTSHAALAARDAIDKHLGPDTWLSSRGAAVSIDGHWLTIDLTVGLKHNVQAPATAWQALIDTSALVGNAKWCLLAGTTHLRADVPIDRVSALRVTDAVGYAVLGMTQGAGGAGGQAFHSTVDATVTHPKRLASILDCLKFEHGWSSSERHDGTTVIELSTAAVAGHAVLAEDVVGYRVSTSILRDAPEVDTVATAVASYLLHCSGYVRGCRAIVNENGSAAFEVRLPTTMTTIELHHALSALSVASGLSRSVVRTLTKDTRLSATYVAFGYSYPAVTLGAAEDPELSHNLKV